MKKLLLAPTLCAAFGAAQAVPVNLLQNGDFEGYTTAQVPIYKTGPGGELWGRDWKGGWDAAGLASSWTDTPAGGAWSGGIVDRTEDFAAGWKWAHSGVIFGGIKDRQVMSQTFTYNGTQQATGSLSWYDAGRPSWLSSTWFGLPNEYSVTITDTLGSTQLIGSFTSEVAGGSEYNSANNFGDERWSQGNKQAWVSRSGQSFTLMPGQSYTLSFNSLSPFNLDGSVQDRTTLLDDVALVTTPVPEPETYALMMAGLGVVGFMARRRRKIRVS